jgi:hypothetical protein
MTSFNFVRNALAIKGLISIVKPIIEKQRDAVYNKQLKEIDDPLTSDLIKNQNIIDEDVTSAYVHNSAHVSTREQIYKDKVKSLDAAFNKAMASISTDAIDAKGQASRIKRMYKLAGVNLERSNKSLINTTL